MIDPARGRSRANGLRTNFDIVDVPAGFIWITGISGIMRCEAQAELETLIGVGRNVVRRLDPNFLRTPATKSAFAFEGARRARGIRSRAGNLLRAIAISSGRCERRPIVAIRFDFENSAGIRRIVEVAHECRAKCPHGASAKIRPMPKS